MNKKISIIIPAYNEVQTIATIVNKLKSDHPDFEIIVVDDGSTDGTDRLAEEAGAIVFKHPHNIGNGAAVKTGIRAAQGETLLFMDADGQHNPDDIREMLSHFPQFDMVVGARDMEGQASSVVQSAIRSIIGWLRMWLNFKSKI